MLVNWQLKRIQFKSEDVVTFVDSNTNIKLSAKYCNEKTYLVTRVKSNTVYTALERKKVVPYTNKSSDQNITKRFHTSQKFPLTLNLIRIYTPETRENIVVITKNFDRPIIQFASIHKER